MSRRVKHFGPVYHELLAMVGNKVTVTDVFFTLDGILQQNGEMFSVSTRSGSVSFLWSRVTLPRYSNIPLIQLSIMHSASIYL